MSKRIDLESAVTLMYQTSDDLELFLQQYYDGPKIMTVDEVFGIVDGIRAMHLLRVEKLYDTYKQKFELDQYCTDPKKLAEREKFYELMAFKPEKKKGKKK